MTIDLQLHEDSMGKRNGPYREEFPIGSLVKIAERPALAKFINDWKLHNKLRPEQLAYAGMIGTVRSVGFYHGGDELYEVEGMPGIWHECCLELLDRPLDASFRFLSA